MKRGDIIVVFLCLMLHCSVAEGSSHEESSSGVAAPSPPPSVQEDMAVEKGAKNNKILLLQADPAILDKNIACTPPNKDAKENYEKLSCCTGRKGNDRTGVRHRLLYLEYPVKGDTK